MASMAAVVPSLCGPSLETTVVWEGTGALLVAPAAVEAGGETAVADTPTSAVELGCSSIPEVAEVPGVSAGGEGTGLTMETVVVGAAP